MIDLYDAYTHIDKKDIQFLIETKGAIRAYYGKTIDGKYRLSFLSSVSPKISGGTNDIDIVTGIGGENNYWTCFDLKNDALLEPFCILAEDLISSVSNEFNESVAILKLKNRFSEWVKLLRKTSKPISEEEVKGLFGELYCLQNYVIPKFGSNKAILGWGGPDNLSKDFAIDNTWIEVKTTGVNSDSVKISSIGQLESSDEGKLYVIKLEKLADASNKANSSINKICISILGSLEDEEVKDIFLTKLSDKGFIPFNDKGDQSYDVHEPKVYIVNNKFPSLKLTDTQRETVRNASYELVLDKLNDFLEK